MLKNHEINFKNFKVPRQNRQKCRKNAKNRQKYRKTGKSRKLAKFVEKTRKPRQKYGKNHQKY